ncbi:MAG: hypothetical protein HDP34_00825 [Clostridia bacterium]|nr:hypothetical protein [Clostridia bacterium]
MKSPKKGFIIFLIITIILLIVNIVLICIFAMLDGVDNIYNALSVSSLLISFSGFASSLFFSMGIYRQSELQNKINDSLNKKDDVYITQNYSLIDIGREISIHNKTISELSPEVIKEENANKYYRFIMLVNDYVNKPLYRADVYTVRAIGKNNTIIFNVHNDKPVPTAYASNILDRGYNCVSFDIGLCDKNLGDNLLKAERLEIIMDITSIFNVTFKLMFIVTLDHEKEQTNNPDAKIYDELRTFKKHSSVCTILDKKIVSTEAMD